MSSRSHWILFSLASLVLQCLLVLSASADVYVWHDKNGIEVITNIKPEWWTAEMDQLDPKLITEPDETAPETPGKYVGDKENRKFHRLTCDQIYNSDGKLAIPDSKVIWFQATDEALSQNFIACDHCKPTEAVDPLKKAE
jgi:hypothetical protein